MAPGKQSGWQDFSNQVGSRTEARALSDSKLLLIPRELVYAEVADNPAFARSLLACISANVHRLLIDLEACTMQTATQRVASFLVRSINSGQTRGDRHVTLAAPKSVVRIFSSTSLPRISLVCCGELLTAQLIYRINGTEVVIENEDGLRAYINGSSPAGS